MEIPAFTKGKKQLSQEEAEMSKQLAHVRIHVERVIGLLKNKYTLHKGPIPVPLLQVNENSTMPGQSTRSPGRSSYEARSHPTRMAGMGRL